jgi:hypothetical protein
MSLPDLSVLISALLRLQEDEVRLMTAVASPEENSFP